MPPSTNSAIANGASAACLHRSFPSPAARDEFARWVSAICLGLPSAEGKVHPSGAHRGDRSLLAADQILAVSAHSAWRLSRFYRSHRAGSLTKSMSNSDHMLRIRFWLAVLIAGLVLSGITAFPLQAEMRMVVSVLRAGPVRPIADAVHLLPWIERISQALAATNSAYPFLAYGTDWLAFAHLVIAVAFVGPFVDPVRNKWLITFGLIACT